ncbi:spore germination protein GerPC [Tepidibacillus sp. LV47]|uniref:spore germination protein GerPC n=1 Tax=Tepidibacillus sp. LV47 TaxID=3398228 RepID=UPI003AB0641B
MYLTPQFDKYIRQLHHYIKLQNQHIRMMEETILQLQTEIDQIKKNQNLSVGKIEYKFDQLKVERLEGTLIIGMSPNGAGTIEDLSLEDQHREDVPIATKSDHPLFNKIRDSIFHYLENDIYNDLKSMEEKKQFHLKDENYRHLLIEDIKKQIDDRIHLYLNQFADQNDDKNQVQQKIIEKIKHDIQNGIQNFFDHFFHKRGEEK